MNASKKGTESADSKSSSGNNNSSPAKNSKAKPEHESGDEENGSGDAKDTKNGATGKKFEGPMALGEIAFIDSKITSTKIDGLQPLYNICFDVAGKAQTLKKNLRTFKGFAFKEDSAEFTQKVANVQKLDIKVLKAICDILDVDKKGSNREIADRICQFLLSPEGEPEPSEDEEGEEEEEEDSEEEKPKSKGPPPRRGGAPAGRPQRSTAGRNFSHDDFLSSEESDEDEPKPKGKRKRGDTDSGSDYNPSLGSDSDTARKKKVTGTRRSARYQSNSEDDDDDDFLSSEEDSDTPKRKRGAPARRAAPARGRGRKKASESEESEPEEDSDESDAPKKRTPAKKGKPAASPKGKGRPKRVATTKKKARDQTTSEEEEEEEEEVDDELSHLQDRDDSEDEPLAKKPKPGFPSDDEIKSFVKKILDEANLEEITMKTVCKEVYAQFPSHDLTHKKDFIKATVKSLIATT